MHVAEGLGKIELVTKLAGLHGSWPAVDLENTRFPWWAGRGWSSTPGSLTPG